MSVRSNRNYMKLRQKSFKNSELSQSEKPPSTAPELIAEHPRLQDSQTSHRDSYSECTHSHTNKKAIGKHMKKNSKAFLILACAFFFSPWIVVDALTQVGIKKQKNNIEKSMSHRACQVSINRICHNL